MNWIDLVIIVIILVFVIIGCCKGFMFSILSLFSAFINFIIALLLTKPINTLLSNWFNMEGSLQNAFLNHFNSMHTGFSANIVGMTNDQLSSHISSTLSESNIPFEKLLKLLLNVTPEKLSGKETESIGNILANSFGSFFSLIISFVIVFIIIYLILFILSLISKKAKQVDGIRATDRILGVVFGLINGALVVVSLFAILSFFKEDGILEPVFNYIKQSQFSGWIYSNVNILVDKYVTLDNVKALIKR